MKATQSLLAIAMILSTIAFNQVASAQSSTCKCNVYGYGCFPGDYYCPVYCQSYCADYCRKHPNKCRLAENSDTSANVNETTLGIYPNPVYSSTTISFYVAQSANVHATVYDVSGNLIQTLSDETFDAGQNNLVWNASDIPAGIYFLKVVANDFVRTEKIFVVR